MNDQVGEILFFREELAGFLSRASLLSQTARALGLPSRAVGQEGEACSLSQISLNTPVFSKAPHFSPPQGLKTLNRSCFQPRPTALLPLPTRLQRYLVLPVPETWVLQHSVPCFLLSLIPHRHLAERESWNLNWWPFIYSLFRLSNFCLYFLSCGFVPFLFLYYHFSKVSERNGDKCAC